MNLHTKFPKRIQKQQNVFLHSSMPSCNKLFLPDIFVIGPVVHLFVVPAKTFCVELSQLLLMMHNYLVSHSAVAPTFKQQTF